MFLLQSHLWTRIMVLFLHLMTKVYEFGNGKLTNNNKYWNSLSLSCRDIPWQQSIHPFILSYNMHPFINVCVHLSIQYSFIHLCMCSSIHPMFIHLSMYMFIYPSSIHSSIYLSIHPFITCISYHTNISFHLLYITGSKILL